MSGRLRRRTQIGIDENMAITQANYVVIDIKLTGLDEERDSILSVGAILMSGGRIELGETFYRVMAADADTTDLHVPAPGVAQTRLLPEPDLAPVLSEFLAVSGHDILTGHLVSTELAFLKNEVKRFLGMEVMNPVIDTYQLYHWTKKHEASGAFYTPRDVKLYEVASKLGVAVSSHHDSMNDAFITAQVFQRLMPMLIRAGVRTVGELLRIGDPSGGLR
jgi:DNA polymerase-3 subunit epsilon